ncbi:MAG TPA: ATP-binding protein [Bacteroidia bacterium]|nr:ATP-binding protein [Bacteroidia bacterium]
MKSRKRSGPLLLFYMLVVYVLIQFAWWTFLLIRLQNEVNSLRRELLADSIQTGQVSDHAAIAGKEKELSDQLRKQQLMIFGEGSVFLLLLILGILRTRSSFRREALVAAQQKNFILSVTHELRSPLASIRLQLETLQKRVLTKERQEEIHVSAIEDIDRLNALIENILVAARIDNHSIRLHLQENDFAEFITDLEAKFRPITARHQLRLDLQPGLRLSFDPIGLHSILENLVENAAKYSPPGSEITIGLKKAAEGIFLTVADRGPGIRNVEKNKIFSRFYRIGNEETRTTRGTGLGLFIVKHLVEAHGWKILVLDRSGGGSIFEIRIPVT